jgi:glutaredoxin-related protein
MLNGKLKIHFLGFPEIPENQIQLTSFSVQSVKFDKTSLDNLESFLESQTSIKFVGVGAKMGLASDSVPIFKHLLNLKTLEILKITTRNFPDIQVSNGHVKALISRDQSPEEFEKLFQMFPGISQFVLSLAKLCLENDEVVALINSLPNLKEFAIDGSNLPARLVSENTDNFLRKLQLRNLEKIQFVEYQFDSHRMTQNFDTFTKNHPNIKHFEVESSDFGLVTIYVIVKNLKQLKKLVIKVPNSTFSWNMKDLKRLRESQ